MVIAHNVDPIELVVGLSALRRKMGVTYYIVKGRSRLRQVMFCPGTSFVGRVDVYGELFACIILG